MSIDQIQLLPERANLDYLRRVAKELLRDARAGDPEAVAKIGVLDHEPKLADAQRALANLYGKRTWAELRNAVDHHDRPDVRRAERSGKHEQDSTFTAARFMAAAQAGGWRPDRLPDVLVFVFQSNFARQLEQDPGFVEEPSLAPGNGRVFLSTDRTPILGVSCLSPGATTMVNQLENQRALDGATTFVAYNLAGGIGADIEPGDISVIGMAVRDDGISDHYLAPGDTVDADPELTERIRAGLITEFPGWEVRTSWTNPAVYRQTEAELDHYAHAGVSLVESETAALFAVAQAVGVKAAAVLVSTSVWHQGEERRADDFSEIGRIHREGFNGLLDILAPRSSQPD